MMRPLPRPTSPGLNAESPCARVSAFTNSSTFKDPEAAEVRPWTCPPRSGRLRRQRQANVHGGHAYSTRNTFITSSPRWLMTFTAIRPLFGIGNGRETSLFSVAHTSALISAFSVVLSAPYGSFWPEEVGVADEEALFVVVGVDEPAGDAVRPVAPDSPGRRIEHVDAFHVHHQTSIALVQNLDVGLAEDDEQVALAGGLELAAHVQVGVHAGLEHRDAAELAELAGVRLVVEGAGDEDVEAGVAGLARGLDEIRPLHCSKLWADEDGGPLFDVPFAIASFRAHHLARPRRERLEGDPVFLVRLLDAGRVKVLEDHLLERSAAAALFDLQRIDQLVVLVDAERAVRAEALDRERPGDADGLRIEYGRS